MRKHRQPQLPTGPMQLVWSPNDYADLERHAAEAIALTKWPDLEQAMAVHPSAAHRSKPYAQAVTDLFQHAGPEDCTLTPSGNPPCPVVDLFTRERLR